MDYDKNTILAFVLIFLVLIAYWMYFSPKVEQRPIEDQQITHETPPDTVQITKKVESDKIEIVSDSTQKSEDKFYPFLVNTDDVPRDIIVESDFFRGIISTRGAVIKSWRLKNYAKPNTKKVDGKILEQNWVELIGPNQDFPKYFGKNVTDDLENYNYGNLAISLPTKFGNGETDKLPFQVEGDIQALSLSKTNPVDSLIFVLKLADGGTLRKKFIFNNKSYDFDLKLELKKISQHLSQSNYQLNWRSGLSPTEENLAEDLSYTKGYALPRKEIITFEVSDDAEEKAKPIIGKFRWIGTTTKYFGLSLVPHFPENADSVSTEALVIGEDIPLNAPKNLVWRKFDVGFKVKSFTGDMISHQYKVYLGPLDYFILKDYHLELERLVDLGKWLRQICIGILYLFEGLHKYISNYGVVLIIFSILIKIVLHPLTKKSYVSMKKMQELQPELAKLKEQYGNDAKKLQTAQMKLYKEKGINPLGGCLPTLLQLPLLFALYQVFRNTISLRGEPFIWWIKDLSMPDTIFTLPFSIPFYGDKFNVLPIVMCAVMFIQQKMTTQDPKQKAMIYLMPVMMLMFFNKLSAGLNLYYTLFNVLSLAQQMMTKTDITVDSSATAKITPEKVATLSQPSIKKASKKKKK